MFVTFTFRKDGRFYLAKRKDTELFFLSIYLFIYLFIYLAVDTEERNKC